MSEPAHTAPTKSADTCQGLPALEGTLVPQLDAQKALLATTSLSCHVRAASVYTFGHVQTVPKETDQLSIVFDNIDFGMGRARMVGNFAAVDVHVTLVGEGPASLNFVEQLATGNVNTLTVFPHATIADEHVEFLVGYSRHASGTMRLPVVSQYVGKCRKMN